MTATGAAFGAGFAAALAAAELIAALPPGRGRLGRAAAALARAGRAGSDPGTAERRQLLGAGAAVALALGALLLGPGAGLLAGAAAPVAAGRLLRARRRRYRAEVDRDAALVATALADALGGGHSLRGAVGQAAAGVPGPAGRELESAARMLELGRATDAVLAELGRAGGPAMRTVAAACRLQRRAGGDLAALLRRSAAAFEDELRLAGEARAATAQARFTALVVIAMPLGGGVLAELAAPGFLAGLAAGPLSLAAVVLALVLQAAAWMAIRRLARVVG